MFISYAQNFEDVILWRALKHIDTGFYIDVGAWSPDEDSVTRAFYEKGWRGINVEPHPDFHQQLQACRCRDVNLAVAVGSCRGVRTMNLMSGLSTFNNELAAAHVTVGWESKPHDVEVTTLCDIWDQHIPPSQDVHFLKIDVETCEDEVIKGNDWARCRPWVVVVEATLPNTQVEAFASWEPTLLAASYRFVYADGLNRFYVAAEHEDLATSFKYPPNWFDHFVRERERQAQDHAQQAEARRQEADSRAQQAEARRQEADSRAQQAEARRQEAEGQSARNLAIATDSIGRLRRLYSDPAWRWTLPIRQIRRKLLAMLRQSPADRKEKISAAGAVQAINPPVAVAGAFTIPVAITSNSAVVWTSEGADSVFCSYHWLDSRGNMLLFDGLRSSLPAQGIQPSQTKTILAEVQAPPVPGSYKLELTLVMEGKCWFETQRGFKSHVLDVQVNPSPEVQAPSLAEGWNEVLVRRVNMTTSCRDCESIAKAKNAGAVELLGGESVQVMHEGTKVVAGGYYGAWMQEIIRQLQGHHEPQEELVFHHLLGHAKHGSRIVEIGCFWAYYSNWYLGAVPGSSAICIEPDANNMSVGQRNILINGRTATFHNVTAGQSFCPEYSMQRESDGRIVQLPLWDWEAVYKAAGGPIELLHVDAKGAELPLLESMVGHNMRGKVRFVVLSTHHASITGSPTTHRDCLAALISLGGSVLLEHSVEESFSGDGLIIASFHTEDANITLPPISRNTPAQSLFGSAPRRAPSQSSAVEGKCQYGELRLPPTEKVETRMGAMNIYVHDSVIGASLKNLGGFEEQKIEEVCCFLRESHSFQPNLFVDIGANIGTHVIYALSSGLFQKAVAIEADPMNFALLRQNTSELGMRDRLRLFNLALSNRTGIAMLERAPDNFGDHRIRTANPKAFAATAEDQRAAFAVVCDTMDDLFEEHGIEVGADTLLWIDTQGHEGHIFGGAHETLAKSFAAVIEFWPYGLARAGGKAPYLDFLRQCDLIRNINCPNWTTSSASDVSSLEALYEANALNFHFHTDLLCMTTR